LKTSGINPKTSIRQRHPFIFWACMTFEIIALLISIASAFVGADPSLAFLALQFLLVPFILSFINVALIFVRPIDDRAWKIKVRLFEIISMLIGFVLTGIVVTAWSSFADWNVQLAMGARHSIIWTQAIPTFVILCLIGLAGYLILAFTDAKITPPFVTVLAIAALYIGVFECVINSIQVYQDMILLIIFPVNCVIIAARLIREKALELKTSRAMESQQKGNFIAWINHELSSNRFPFWALVLAFPLLGLAIAYLTLFGQRPDYIIKGYTETADWVFSQKIAPPGYDDHYLCTVAAQGHAKLVKPQRIGVRHGRQTIVNRQLCVANAFEQIIEERTPRMHRAIRKFYDTYGFPISRVIKSKFVADIIYLIMKPLEWVFLITLYLCTVNPEERIHRQYRA
jgi:hypothetical protein